MKNKVEKSDKVLKFLKSHCEIRVQIQSFFLSGFSTGKYGPEKTPYLNTFHALSDINYSQNFLKIRDTLSIRFKDEFSLFCNFITGKRVRRDFTTRFWQEDVVLVYESKEEK